MLHMRGDAELSKPYDIIRASGVSGGLERQSIILFSALFDLFAAVLVDFGLTH